MNKLNGEKWIASRLLVDQLRQWLRALRPAMQGIGDDPADIIEPEGRQYDLLDLRSGLADRRQRPRKWVREADFVVPVSSDQQQVPHLSVRDQVLEEVERRGIQPL